MKRVYIEILNICNLECAFCKKNHRKPEFMSVQSFETILQQVKPLTSYIYLHVQGEPLLHPFFNEILDLCDTYQMNVQLVTNGTYLNKYRSMFNHKSLRKISFSLQSIEYQKDIVIEDYLSDILNFATEASNSGNCYVEIRFWREDQSIMPKTAYCLNYLEREYSPEPTSRNGSRKIMNNVFISYDNSFTWPDINSEDFNTIGRCHGAIDQIAILVDGTLVPCCLDADGEINLGNVFTSPLTELLQSIRYKRMVDGFKHNTVCEPFCQRCSFRHRFDRL